MRISDWSSDVCSSDLRLARAAGRSCAAQRARSRGHLECQRCHDRLAQLVGGDRLVQHRDLRGADLAQAIALGLAGDQQACERGMRRRAVMPRQRRSEEHTSELQSLMRISYAVCCLKKQNNANKNKSK